MAFGPWLMADQRQQAWRWLETVLLTLLATALSYAASPLDPFFVEAEFPWVLFAPALLALRYGVLPGLGSVAVLAAVWALERSLGLVHPAPPTLYFMGALLLTLVCGEFASIWNGRLRRIESTYRYAREKLERLTRQHYLLLLSHDRLEQDQLAKPVTLRAALARIRNLTTADDAAAPHGLPGLPVLAALLAQFCQLEVAGFHACTGGKPDPQPLAAIGPARPLDLADPMVLHCLESKALAHVRMGGLSGAQGGRYVVVAPVLDSEGRLLALFAIEQMPFLALHEETLSTLAVLLGYYADWLQVSRQARVVQRALPGCPIEFAAELVRVHRMRAQHAIPSTLLLLRFGGHPDSAAFSQLLRRQLRDLDTVWELPLRPGTLAPVPDLLVLLPLAGPAGAEGALARLENALELRHFTGFDGARIRPYDTQIEAADPFVTLKLFLDQHDVRL
jgi:polysaccharide biosynthesis protein PelD